MKVLVFCEYSGVVLEAFLAEGHDAYSADLLPTESIHKDRHFEGDGLWLLQEPWDLVIAHPPCQYLSTARGKPSDDDDSILAAMEFFMDCRNANAPKVAVENPQMYKFAQAVVGKPDCKVEPHYYGSDYSKRTFFG